MCSKTSIVGLLLLFVSCNSVIDKNYVQKIIVYRNDNRSVIDLDYDDDGRIIKFSHSSIHYSYDNIFISGKIEKNKNIFDSITFKIAGDRAIESNSLCKLNRLPSYGFVHKNVHYNYNGDSINLFISYCNPTDKRILERDTICFVFDKMGSLIKKKCKIAINNKPYLTLSDFFRYDNGINFSLNIDIIPFFTYLDGVDLLLYFLLDLNGKSNNYAMPSNIWYNMNGNIKDISIQYIMDNDFPKRIEMITDSMKLVSRIDFEYMHLN